MAILIAALSFIGSNPKLAIQIIAKRVQLLVADDCGVVLTESDGCDGRRSEMGAWSPLGDEAMQQCAAKPPKNCDYCDVCKR